MPQRHLAVTGSEPGVPDVVVVPKDTETNVMTRSLAEIVKISYRKASKIFWVLRRKWQPTPVLLPGESQRRRSLVGCCLWGRSESDRTEAT